MTIPSPQTQVSSTTPSQLSSTSLPQISLPGPIEQAPSLQTPWQPLLEQVLVLFAYLQPLFGSQLSVVHGLSSSQETAAPALQTPAAQIRSPRAGRATGLGVADVKRTRVAVAASDPIDAQQHAAALAQEDGVVAAAAVALGLADVDGFVQRARREGRHRRLARDADPSGGAGALGLRIGDGAVGVGEAVAVEVGHAEQQVLGVRTARGRREMGDLGDIRLVPRAVSVVQAGAATAVAAAGSACAKSARTSPRSATNCVRW